MAKWHYESGELRSETLLAQVDPQSAPIKGWAHTGLRVADVKNGMELPSDNNERVILIASGESVTITYEDQEVILAGRESVFHGPSDVLYLPINTAAKIDGDARVIIGEAPARNKKKPQIMRKDHVPVLLRGAGRESRQIHNFCMPDTMDADRLICVEGIVPAGNWSGVPAHKHDRYIPGKESQLEEIYYFEAAVTKTSKAGGTTEPFGYFRGYSSDEREFELDNAVHHGDVVLVPHGYHGPVAAAPGSDLYFFNVMAGPDEKREWLVTDDPAHAWIRETWNGQDVDSRLPYIAQAQKEGI
jgi:5-deoxy-glucuronate isomerase